MSVAERGKSVAVAPECTFDAILGVGTHGEKCIRDAASAFFAEREKLDRGLGRRPLQRAPLPVCRHSPLKVPAD